MSTIDSIIDDTTSRDKKQIDKLIGDSFQIFDMLVPVNDNTFVSNSTIKNTKIA